MQFQLAEQGPGNRPGRGATRGFVVGLYVLCTRLVADTGRTVRAEGSELRAEGQDAAVARLSEPVPNRLHESGSALRAESLDRADATESRATESPGSGPSALDSPPLFRPLPLDPPVPVGLVVEMDLPELGLTDLAWVTDISECPKIEPVDSQHSPSGRVVTATFHRSSGDVIDLVMRDSDLHPSAPSLLPSEETIGTTSNHPFWSVDRQEYVQAGQLDTGERVLTFYGDTKRVVTKLPRPGPQPVYNLEVHAEHVYFVGEDGLLVHNSAQYLKGARFNKNRTLAVNTVNGQKRAYKLTNGRWRRVGGRTRNGDPEWDAARKSYWQSVASTATDAKYSRTNIERMQQGLAPQVRARVRLADGTIETRTISMELHHRHLMQRSGATARHQSWNLTETLPPSHASMDQYRHVNYTIEKITQTTRQFDGS